MKNKFSHKIKSLLEKPFFASVFIFLAAAIFRIFFLSLIEFKFDEAFNVYQLTEFYLNPSIAYHSGLSSSGIHNFPLLHYILIILGFFSRDPQYLSFLIALINTFLVSVFYLIIKKFYGNFVAFFSSLFLAFSPWAILYSRKIWHPDLILLFLIPIFYLVNQAIVNKKIKFEIILFLLLTLLFQQHFSGIYMLVLTILIFKIFKINLNYKKVILGFFIGLIPMIPYVNYNLFSSPFCTDCFTYFEYQKQIKFFDLNNFIRPLQIINGSYFENALGKDYNLFVNMFPFVKILNYIFILESFFIIWGVVFIVKFRRQYLFLVFYIIFIPAIYFLTKTPARMYYFIIILPILILIYTLSFKFLLISTRKSLIKFLVLSFLIFSIIFNFIFEFYFYKFLSFKKSIDGNYGPVFAITKKNIEEQTANYVLLPYYEELKSFAYVFSNPLIIHAKLGEFFLSKKQPLLAMEEFKKAIKINPNDIFSRGNLTYLLIASNNLNEAKKHLDILSKQDSTLSAKLKRFLEETEDKQFD